MAKEQYSLLTSLWKSIKNNAVCLIPFLLAIMANIPAEYAWIVSVLVYGLKNTYEFKTGKKLI